MADQMAKRLEKAKENMRLAGASKHPHRAKNKIKESRQETNLEPTFNSQEVISLLQAAIKLIKGSIPASFNSKDIKEEIRILKEKASAPIIQPDEPSHIPEPQSFKEFLSTQPITKPLGFNLPSEIDYSVNI